MSFADVSFKQDSEVLWAPNILPEAVHIVTHIPSDCKILLRCRTNAKGAERAGVFKANWRRPAIAVNLERRDKSP
jgi:hypothetical protein